MRKLFTIIVSVLLAATVFAQAPQKISYQAVIRNSSELLVTNTQIGMEINIRQGSPTGTIVYTETQTPTTNANGLVSIEIGGGVGFSSINWAANTYYIETKTAVVAPLTTYTITGVSQLLSVPYALNAKTAETVTGGITETDPVFVASPSNGITNTNITNWNTAYVWGNHATAGYLSSYTETDPTVPANVKSITSTNISNWNTAYTHSTINTGSVHGSTTLGGNLLRITNPSAISFLRINTDNSVSSLNAADFRTAIGAGTGNGTVISIASDNGITGGTITTSGTLGLTGNALGLHNLNTNGLITRTAAGTITSRSINISGNGISVSNGDGVNGNPTLSLNFGSGSTQVAEGNHTHTGLLPSGTDSQTLRHNGTNWLASDVLYNNGTALGIGASPLTNTQLYVYRPSRINGANYTNIYARRNGAVGPTFGGTSWALLEVDAAIKAYSYYGNTYSAAMAGYSDLDYINSTAVIGYHNAATWGAFAYKDNALALWAGYFTGNTKTTGMIIALDTVKALDFKYNTPKTHYLSVASASFIAENTAYTYQTGGGSGGAFFTSICSSSLSTGVNLPHGATVTGFKVYFYDNSAQNLNVSLYRLDNTYGGYLNLASVATSGTLGYSNLSTSTISNPVINNQNYSYLISAYSNWDGTGNLRIMSVLITYTTTEVE